MFIKIEIDTREALSDEDKALLRAIGYMDEAEAAPKPVAKKTAAKKAAAPKPETPGAEELTPDNSEGPDEAPAEETDEELTKAALARGSELLASGTEGKERVIAALAAAGAERISLVPADKIAGFLAALTD